MKLENELLQDMFEFVSPCSLMSIVRSHLIWVIIKNIPLGVWDAEFFKAMVNQVGTLVALDRGTQDKSRFDMARMLF